MYPNLRSILLELLALTALVPGCSLPQKTSARHATAHAVHIANQQADQLYGFKPFTAETGQIVLVSNRWQWQDLTHVGHLDILGRVSFRRDFSDPVSLVEAFDAKVAPPREREAPLPAERLGPRRPADVIER